MTPRKNDQDYPKPVLCISESTLSTERNSDGFGHNALSSVKSEEKLSPLYKENDAFACNAQSQVEGRSDALRFEDSPLARWEPTRGPLKKRPATPIPCQARHFTMSPLPPPHKALSTHMGFHGIPTAPLLRQTSSAFSVYSHHQHVHPQACLTTSCGRMLMSQPLLATPNAAMTPGSVPRSWSLGNPNNFQPQVDAMRISRNKETPGLDLLAEQVVRNTRNSHAIVTAPRHHETKRLKKSETRQPGFEIQAHRNEASIRIVNRSHPAASLGYAIGDYHHTHAHSFVPPNSIGAQVHTIPFSVNRNDAATVNSSYRPPQDPVLIYPDLFAHATSTSKPCKCANSKCLKLYCECFRGGVLCDGNLCRCKDCRNNSEHNTRKGPREYAILKIIAKRPDAFHTEIKRRTGNWCKCQKNNCIKKYCECVAQGRNCSGQCKCRDCENNGGISVLEPRGKP